MNITRGKFVYEGKAKRIFEAQGKPSWIVQEFKDSLTAFNGVKKGSFADKGKLNRDISSLAFRFLSKQGIRHHWISNQGEREFVTEKVDIFPLEVVVRNRAAGSLAKKFKWEEGKSLPHPLVEFYYKSDELGDPFINDEHAMMLSGLGPKDIEALKVETRKINTSLKEFFGEAGMELVDFKIEFGKTNKGEVLLADEVTPDTCRLWDTTTHQKMDKDRFRQDLGKVEETYHEVCERLIKAWEGKL